MRDCDYYPAEEIWKPVQGFESLYEISNFGRVKSIGKYNTCKRGIMKPMVDPCGYEHVALYNQNNRKDISIHRLVAIAFIPNPNGYKYVNHIDENRTNNVVSNLEWCTNSYNIAYSRGKRVCQFTKDGEYLATYNCIQDASREYGIPTTNISKCCKGIRHTAGGYVWYYESELKQ